MENKDLKFIKKQYGEDFMHLCRTLFPTILEKEGMLSDIISSKFAPSNSLYEDLTLYEGDTLKFKSFIFDEYNKIVNQKDEIVYENSKKTPEELLDKAGYILYPECKTEEEIQSFRKYWQKGEELCTFTYGNRLKSCRVWFAIKKNIDEIKRENFNLPKVKKVFNDFLKSNNKISKVNLPKLRVIGNDFLASNNVITELNLPKALTIGNNFLRNNYNTLETISLPNVEQIGIDFMKCNENIKNLYLPSLKYVGKGMLENNNCLENAYIPKFTLEKLEKTDMAKYHPNRKNLLEKIDTINKKYINYNQKQTNNNNDELIN